jgi:hypothetical protein
MTSLVFLVVFAQNSTKKYYHDNFIYYCVILVYRASENTFFIRPTSFIPPKSQTTPNIRCLLPSIFLNFTTLLIFLIFQILPIFLISLIVFIFLIFFLVFNYFLIILLHICRLNSQISLPYFTYIPLYFHLKKSQI